MQLPAWARSEPAGLAASIAATAVVTSALAPLQDSVGLLNEGLILLLLALLVSATWGWRVGLFAAVLNNLSLNFFFVPPLHTLTVQDPENVIALLIFLVVAMVGGMLLSSARHSAAESQRRQAETQVLLNLSRAMIGRTHPEDALAALCEEVVAALRPDGAAVLSASGGAWRVLASAGASSASRAPTAEERAMAERALTANAPMGLGRTGLTAGRPRRIAVSIAGRRRIEEMKRALTLVPLRVGDRAFGVLRLDGPITGTVFGNHPRAVARAVRQRGRVRRAARRIGRGGRARRSATRSRRDEDGADDLDLARPENAARGHQDLGHQLAR